jgi:hypothetical protein
VIFAKRTHLRIKPNPTESNLIQPIFINGQAGLCQNGADGSF